MKTKNELVKKMYQVVSVLVILFALMVSCKKDVGPKPEDPQNPNEAELITTVKLILTETGSGSVSTFRFSDIDGPGGLSPVKDAILLDANKTYTGRIVLLDQTKVPADSISNEVAEEGDDHQFFFTINGANLNYQYTDFDSHGVPVGLLPEFTTGAASNGTLKVTLKHQPGVKPTTGNGNISLGETDIEVVFNVTIQ